MAFTEAQLLDALRRLPTTQTYWVAYSGGRDSHVLLRAIAELRPRLAADVRAVHVDHGLNPDAAKWGDHCQSVCEALTLPLRRLQVDARDHQGKGPEAAAREARYRALTEVMGQGDILLTAHHRDDQAETVLLQLLRGAGPAGLAAMPEKAPRPPGWLARPLLGFSRRELADYASDREVQWIEDPGNQDTGPDRNFLRHQVLPLLSSRWPGIARTLARSAAHCAEAKQLIDGIAAERLESLQHDDTGCLPVDALLDLDAPQRRAVLRAWLRRLGLPVPDAAHLGRIEQEVLRARPDRMPLVHWPGGEARRFRGLLYAMPPIGPIDPATQQPWRSRETLLLPGQLGSLSLVPAIGQGIRRDLSLTARFSVRFRQGGEVCRLRGQAHHRSLKNLYQERGIPPWERPRIPLLYVDDRLAGIADIWVCEPFAAQDDEPGLVVRWDRGEALHRK